MNPGQLEQIKEIFYAAAEHPPERRSEFLVEACAGDVALRTEVERLLAEHDRADGFLENPFNAIASLQCLTGAGRTLEINQVIAGRYRIVSFLAEGGMGVVYKAEDTRLPRFVALKFLANAVAEDPQSLARLRQEAQAASAVNHPNICTIHDVAESEGQTFIVMEYVDGHTLKEMIGSGHFGTEAVGADVRGAVPLPLDSLLRIAVQITDGLEAAHARGIVHRDIKPANIFLTKSGHVKVLDFGIAKVTPVLSNVAAAGTAQSTLKLQGYLTRTGPAAGTIGYMSPEQVSAKVLDVRTDLFSFGAVLYEMATGSLPFRGESTELVFASILNGTPVPSVRLNPDLSPKLDEIIGKCLQKDRDLRYECVRRSRRSAATETGPGLR